MNEEQSIIGNSLIGASSLAIPLIQEEALVESSEMPMIVWLRGDEPNLDEFCLDADSAMKALGIKRSRLTQISGRELRVGRLRVDRYTRPMYRTEDIETYKAWTRSTASHLRASSVIQEAATRLEEQSKGISDELRRSFVTQLESLDENLDQLAAQLTTQQQFYSRETNQVVNALLEKFLLAIDKNNEEIRARMDAVQHSCDRQHETIKVVSTLAERIEAVTKQQDALSSVVDKLSASSDLAKIQVDEFRASQLQFNRDFGRALAMIIQYQREAGKKFDEFAQAPVQPVVAEEIFTNVKPKRRLPFALRRRVAQTMIK